MDLQGVQIKVEDVMTPNPLRVEEDTPIETVFQLFAEHHLNCLPVVDQADRLQGCILLGDLERSRQLFDLKEYINIIMAGLEEDIRSRIANSFSLEGPIDLRAREVMTVNILKVRSEDSLSLVSQQMLEKRSHHAFVVDNQNRLAGILSSFDFIKLFAPATAHS